MAQASDLPSSSPLAGNPLMDLSGLAPFDAIRPEHITPAITALMERAQQAVDKLEADQAADAPATWQSVVETLDEGTEGLSRAWSVVGHLNSVADTPELRAAYGENLPRVTEFWAGLGQNQALYERYKKLAAGKEFQHQTPARKKLIENELRGFRLGGAELPEAAKPRFAEIQEQQATQSKAFSDHVLDATNTYALIVRDEAELAGLPDDVKEAAREAARKAPAKEGEARDDTPAWKFTLHFPSYFPVLQYADNRALRETMYKAHVTRASELGPEYGQGQAEWDNTAIMLDLLRLRREEAGLLGYANYGEVSLVPKMADTPEQVQKFLAELAERAHPYAERDLRELREFAAAELGLGELEPWDIAYASEKLRQARYAFSENEVKQYFPEPKVLAGLFKVIETLFSVRIRPDSAPAWHPDVRFFRVESAAGTLLAQFYLDLYARDGKRGGAWMDDARTRYRRPGGQLQTPVAYLVCNFTPPSGGKPSLFTHDEVITLFHECGHGLHHMLTQMEDLGVSGINGVEWDAVELPSQFMENFCWEWAVLEQMTAHAETGAPLPRTLYDKMVAAKNFQGGLMTLRQVVLAATDMHLHTDYDPDGPQSVLALSRAVNDRMHVLPQPQVSRWINTFSHIFAGGYSAGYYSYKWAEVLSADAYAAFEDAATEDTLRPEVGERFLREILQVGGSRPAIESFRAFRGREPSIEALLRHSGMADAVAS
ncbi:M3 family peptidase [Pigmentiphaga sp. H8]|uniref:M3 family metallopeptidase n=1 Tax=Pigmentiphaga sp. H8 TaxID=2488560 RepID=UPI000F5AF210|nr:M3 family metallopeptidase [Pigmentiphaga sp. H8]AZG08464.1 M3 family peptidase [Pigmentiphaga sp. H8]